MVREFDLGGSIVSWGRNAGEYEAFFALADIPSSARVLDCGSGPSSFCAEWRERGRAVVAADPLYARPAREIAAGFKPTAARMLEGMRRARARFDWERYGSPETVIERRRAALEAFLGHAPAGARAGSYVGAALPRLPFSPDSFDLVLCSHLLFLYSDELDLGAHVECLEELLRVGREVRVYPLLDMSGEISPHLDGCVAALRARARVEIVTVPYEFRSGDTKMLKLGRLQGAR